MRTPTPRTLALVAALLAACSSSSATLDSSVTADVSTSDATTPVDGATPTDATAPTDATSDASTADTAATDAPVTPPADGAVTSAAVTAAQAFLATLSDAQRTAVSRSFTDATQTTHWSNFPTGIFQRNGVKLGDLSQAQQDALFALLRSILSTSGYQQIVDAIDADEALRASSSGGALVFGRAEYYVTLQGTPSTTAPWRVQFGGHHMAINATLVGANVTLAPSLTGCQPTAFMRAGVAVRPQGVELDHAFAFVNGLTAAQRTTAIVSATFMDLALGPGRDGVVLTPEGVRGSDLTAAQQTQLLELIRDRVGMVNDAAAALRRAEIASRIADTYFAWAGPTTVGSAAYYRITGPTLAIEYSPQSMGSATNHTHAMYRDPTNDYGAAFPR